MLRHRSSKSWSKVLTNLDELNAIISEEGMHDAVEEVRKVLAINGADKYPVRNWYDNVSYERHLEKAEGHLIREGREDESGRMHLAHCIARLLFCLQMELDDE